jgi:hypothetical protein
LLLIYRLRFLTAQKPIANGTNAADPHGGETGLDEGIAVGGIEVAGRSVAEGTVAGVAVSGRDDQGVGVSVSQRKS